MIERDFFDRPVVEVACDLIGTTLRVGDATGVIVETEAYHESEPACHAYVGRTARTETLFGPPGLAYVYRSYGIHALLNAVCEPEGVGAAVLIRAVEPLEGLDEMRRRRGLDDHTALCSGPGKLSVAFGIELDLNGSDLLIGPIRIEPPPAGRASPPIVSGTRIGITKAANLPWRFAEAGNPHVSRPRPAAWQMKAAA